MLRGKGLGSVVLPGFQFATCFALCTMSFEGVAGESGKCSDAWVAQPVECLDTCVWKESGFLLSLP